MKFEVGDLVKIGHNGTLYYYSGPGSIGVIVSEGKYKSYRVGAVQVKFIYTTRKAEGEMTFPIECCHLILINYPLLKVIYG